MAYNLLLNRLGCFKILYNMKFRPRCGNSFPLLRVIKASLLNNYKMKNSIS